MSSEQEALESLKQEVREKMRLEKEAKIDVIIELLTNILARLDDKIEVYGDVTTWEGRG